VSNLVALNDKELRSYLDRIGYSGARKNSLGMLRKLHRQHLISVPFENIDIQIGRPIVLSEHAFYKKIVKEHRGGFCYELNGSFANLLRALDFEVEMLSARVAREEGGFTPEFDHMALLVNLAGERFLADVGFGDSFIEPKRIDYDEMQEDGSGREYKITRIGSALLLSQRSSNDSLKPQYRFSLIPRSLKEFAPRCEFQQSSPLSHFRKGWICSKLTPTGRVSLTHKKLIVTNKGKRFERPIEGRSDLNALLRRHFSIIL
jgi:N-hydroxyarylamine O-acetyltransferase